ncbi:hypothetical protein Llan_1912 [Legionella lansingensis]|uniref:Uncharacterized protein n=1 Tax=Legionella lansingensis TaxID=45067 RepID=A0A0W0VJH5_9GAMM|nr:hypothetical protein Llan_1912 [Legionella lansingensis]
MPPDGREGLIRQSLSLLPHPSGALKCVQNASPHYVLFASHFVEPLSVRTLPGQLIPCSVLCSEVIVILCFNFRYGAPGRIRTSDPLVRSQILYPTELRARVLAEREGFEPSMGFLPYSLSRGAPSASRPSLH